MAIRLAVTASGAGHAAGRLAEAWRFTQAGRLGRAGHRIDRVAGMVHRPCHLTSEETKG